MKKRIIVSVSNDVATDQRVRKQCAELHDSGYEVFLIGRKLSQSPPVERPYKLKLMALPFRSGALFYASLNVALFFILVFSKADIYWANDLDTLPANRLAAFFRGKPLVYDSHEFFTEVPEIQDNPFVKAVWSFFERICISGSSPVITVNKSIAGLLEERYGIGEVLVVRNVPDGEYQVIKGVNRRDYDLPEEAFLLVLQGTGINIDRGGEELVRAMKELEGSFLMIIGNGDAIPVLKSMVKEMGIMDRVKFFPRMSYPEMMNLSSLANLGLSLDKDTNLNYRYSLPNKLFDYMRAGIPILAGDLPEVGRLIRETGAGFLLDEVEPSAIADAVERLQDDPERISEAARRAKEASENLSWKKEFQPVLKKLREIHG